MDALEPSKAMLATAAAKKIYTNCIEDYLDTHGTSVENGQYTVCVTIQYCYTCTTRVVPNMYFVARMLVS